MEAISVLALLCVVFSVGARSVVPTHYVELGPERHITGDYPNTVALIPGYRAFAATDSKKDEEQRKIQQYFQALFNIDAAIDLDETDEAENKREVLEYRAAFVGDCGTGFIRYYDQCCPIKNGVAACDR